MLFRPIVGSDYYGYTTRHTQAVCLTAVDNRTAAAVQIWALAHAFVPEKQWKDNGPSVKIFLSASYPRILSPA